MPLELFEATYQLTNKRGTWSCKIACEDLSKAFERARKMQNTNLDLLYVSSINDPTLRLSVEDK